jgi:hypothetical protein
MNVVPFKPPRVRRRFGPPVVPPAALSGALSQPGRSPDADADDDRLRMRQNLAAMIVITTIVVLGAWLIDSLRHYSRIQSCIEAGHRNCIPIEAKFQPSPFRS